MASLLLQLFNKPELAQSFNSEQWTHIITHGRNQNMLGRLYSRFKARNLTSELPNKVRIHMENCEKTEQRQRINIHRELSDISNALSKKNVDSIVLKGAAYSILNLDCANGRIFNDIDVLVAKTDIRKAEIGFMTKSWFHTQETDYDKRYFREWMHEIPPMVHKIRHTTIDLHHNILPITNRQHFSSHLLEREPTQYKHIYVLTPVDRFIHSAVHLFTESDFPHAIRDLTDLVLLFNDLEASTGNDSYSVTKLIRDRASDLNLGRYINLGLYFVLLQKQQDELHELEKQLTRSLKDRLTFSAYRKVFNQDCAVATSIRHKIALFWLFTRSHIVKMPLRILIPHLVRKLIFNTKKRFNNEEAKNLL